jgi:hypothetical protein
MNGILRMKNSTAISSQVPPDSLLYVSAGNLPESPVDESEMTRKQIWKHNRSEVVVCDDTS